LVRFSVNPTPKQEPSAERFAAQLALARVHPCLIPLESSAAGYAISPDQTRGWFELRSKRGLAGYGLARALRMLLDALSGITALEDTRTKKGEPFVHGELVPAMLRVDPTGTARLVPLAPWHWSPNPTLPLPERRGHLAPERLLGDAIDARADVFSAGVLLWEALAGGRLFEVDSVDGIVTRLLGGKITLPELPPELSWAMPLKAVAMCALSVDPEQRFDSCAELAEAIQAVAGDQIATHADVANYFRLPDPTARPSSTGRPSSLPPVHHSSLSALVAPIQRSVPVENTSSVAVRRERVPAKPQVNRSLWAITAVSCALTAFGAGAIARYKATAGNGHTAASTAPVVGVQLPSGATAAQLPVAPFVPPPAAAPVERAAPTTAVTSPPAEEPDQLPKPRKPGSAAKASAAKPRSPVRSLSFDKAAAKYGI